MGYLRSLLTSTIHALSGAVALRDAIGSGTLTGAYAAGSSDAYVVALDPGGASRTVTLPPAHDGRVHVVRNTADADERLTVQDSSGTVHAIVPADSGAIFAVQDRTWQLVGYLGPTPLPRRAVQTIDMADAQVALVYGTAGAGQVKITSEVLIVDANSGSTEDLLLPPEATSFGRVLFVSNSGGEDIVVKEDSDTTTIATISTAESAFFVCDGTTWRGGVVKAT